MYYTHTHSLSLSLWQAAESSKEASKAVLAAREAELLLLRAQVQASDEQCHLLALQLQVPPALCTLALTYTH